MIRCYRYKRGGGKSSNGETTANGKSGANKAITGLELVHETPCEGAPLMLRNFEGKLLVGVDDVLRLYDFGKKKLLRKAECAQKFPSFINDIRCSGDRFFVTDACESAFFVKYVREDDQNVPCTSSPTTLRAAVRHLHAPLRSRHGSRLG